jgi:hypothetical protein
LARPSMGYATPYGPNASPLGMPSQCVSEASNEWPMALASEVVA